MDLAQIFSLDTIQFRDEFWVLLIPLACICVDFVTGVLHAWSTGHLKSYRMREGLVRKSGELFVLILGEAFTWGMKLPIYIIDFLSLYIIVMELISIIENLRKMGVKIPKFIEKALESIDDKLEGDDDKNDSDEGGDI